MMYEIQQELKAPKGQYNSFGKYYYRSCEDIVEAAKPILQKRKLHLLLTDEMVCQGDRHYVKATASVIDEDKVVASACGWAREALTKKGMDESQITGAASSYARKYALNGLFAIDDAKDADTNEHQNQRDNAPDTKPSQDDDKPWYNDFEEHQPRMLAKVRSGESTPESIVKSLRENFKVSRKVADQIMELGK